MYSKFQFDACVYINYNQLENVFTVRRRIFKFKLHLYNVITKIK